MEITEKLLLELQNRLKVGSRRGVHLNAIPARSRYKFDLTRLSHIDENLPQNFINALLSDQHLKFKVSWKDNVPDLNSLFEDDQVQLVKITKSFENLINQTDAIESEKGINTFGFGFPLLIRRDQSDKKLTVAPILIWSLKIKRTKEFNTWVILRDEDDPIYINEVLINHLQSDSQIEINPIPPELLDDGLIDKGELIDICVDLIKTVNSSTPNDLRDTFKQKTIFEIIEETLEEVLDDNLANRHSIYITDVCKACNYTLFDKMRDKSKSKVFKSCRDNFFKEELKKINPKVVLSLGGSAYSSYTALDGIEDTIYPSKESPTGRMSSNKNGDEGDHGKVYLSKNKRYLIPLIHPSGAARGSSGKDDDYGRTVKKALTHVADDFRLREKT